MTSFLSRSFGTAAALGAILALASLPATAQEVFPTADAAAEALVAAAKAGQPGFVERIFGPEGRSLLASGDQEEDKRRLETFVAAAAEQTSLVEKGEATRVLVLGQRSWPFPVPIVKSAAGWRFDVEAGRTELTDRIVGFNELSAIEACRTYVAAQREYYRSDRDDDGVQEYAQRLISRPGRRDGLYWPAESQADRSPLDGRISASVLERARTTPEPYHGYVFRVLKRQGKHAPGGAYGYVINGRMIAGFALVAYPEEYGRTGIMTFVCGQQGKVFQRDLGPRTAAIGAGMTRYDPGPGWALVD